VVRKGICCGRLIGANVMLNFRFLVASLAYLCVCFPQAWAQSTQCSNGVDDDGDGGVDALIEIPEYNGASYTFAGPGGVGSPHELRATVERMIRDKKMQLTPPIDNGASLLRSDHANWDWAGTFDTGVPHLPSLQQVCRILGYRDYVASTCRDGERSWRYPHGKCNYHSTHDNNLWRFTGSNYVLESSAPQLGKTWIATITCQHKLAACNDGWDNDGDGRIDLQDPDCLSKNDDSERRKDPKCKSPSGLTEFEECRNSIDDDRDGAIDATDPGCWKTPGVPASYDPNLDNEGRDVVQCKDGIDNDGDGATDMSDFSCSSPDDNDERNPKAQCQDGIDNDHDGRTDMSDPGCSSPQDNDEYDAKTQCQDGIDNDGDGATDMSDFSCSSPDDNDERNPKAQCQDGMDNDHDGRTDMADPGCSSPQDNDEYDAKTQCQDGIDNDGDGATDMSDFSCSSPDDNDERNPRSQCQDGVDNDNDGKVDMFDPGCSSAQDNDECDGKTQCSDGIDNDRDGAIDLADYSCSNAGDDDESYPKSQCQDGIDNDADGLVDLSDPGCSTSQDNDECNDAQAVKLGLDCVYNNRDGTYTAYFGYEYLGGQALEVLTNTALGTQNDIHPAPRNRGQVTTFQPGRHPGSSPILFDGAPLTWTVRTQGGGLSSVTASKSSPSCKPIQPRAECVQDSGTVVFGYANPNPFAVRINVGFLNSVYPAPRSGTQPVTFLSGLHPAVFTTTLKDSAEWSLDGSLAKVTSSTPGCTVSGCSTHNTGALRDNIVYASIQMGEITKQALYTVHGPTGAKGRTSRAKAGATRRAVRGVSPQIQRASSRADELVQTAMRLSSGIPELMYSCANPSAGCRTIDRGETLRALSNVYSSQLKQLSSLMSSKQARSAGVRSKLQPLVVKAKALKAQGESSLAQCPRFDKECR
jgi:hypothetical protein